MNFIRIFNNLNAWLTMISLLKTIYPYPKTILCYLTLGSLIISTVGCQKLFHAQDAPLKGQTVTVSMTVPETPRPAAKPLQPATEQAMPQSKPVKGDLDSRLLPIQAPPPADPLSVKTSFAPVLTKQVNFTRTTIAKADTVLSGKTVAEDLVLRGTVLIKGSLVVAPQATLRVEPGTLVRFATAPGSSELPRLVIQGRIVAVGTVQQPVVFGPAFNESAAGDWGGIVLLNSEKKNSLDHCRIEGALTGLEAYFSHFSGKGFVVTRSGSGVALFDSEASLQGSTISRCDTGCRLSDSELDLKDSTMQENRQGIAGQRSSFTLTSVKIINNSQEGIVADQCRFRLNSSLFAENRSGVKFTGGDGQFFLCRFYQNRENGAELAGVRIRISNTAFTRNAGVGLLIENARGSIAGSAFSENRGGNLYNRGHESFAALLNWWGSTDEKQIAAGILDHARNDAAALVSFSPFLKERPATAP
jgi:hypothetical protein